jgi:RNA polymerase sigma-70 factor (ECF subfamily)
MPLEDPDRGLRSVAGTSGNAKSNQVKRTLTDEPLPKSGVVDRPPHVAAPPVSRLTPDDSSPVPDYSDDRELIAAILRGDRGAAGALYDHLRPIIDHTLRRILHGQPSDFEDLVQTTFERIIRAVAEDRYEGRSRLTTWAAAIAGHVAMDAVRRKVREARFFTNTSPEADSMEAPRSHAPERRLEARSEIRHVHAVLSRMKPDLVEVLVLHDVLGHEVSEIAELTKAGLSTTHSRLARARKEFLRRIGAHTKRGARS